MRRLPKVFAFVDFAVTIPMEELHIIGPCCGCVTSFVAPRGAGNCGGETSRRQMGQTFRGSLAGDVRKIWTPMQGIMCSIDLPFPRKSGNKYPLLNIIRDVT